MAHALLSPSAAHRWLHCTPSARLESLREDKGSSFAEEGTLAHAWCSKTLREFYGMPLEDEERIIEEFDGKYHTAEMDEAVALYVSTVMEKLMEARRSVKDARLLVEVRLDLTEYMPEAYGTADAVIISDGTMEVIDFKYGKGVKVEAHENPQMMIYALGAYEAFSIEYNIRNVCMTIIQPRLDNISEYSLDVADLLEWGHTELYPKAAEAFKGSGMQKPGAWCQFCKVKGDCYALADKCLNTFKKHSNQQTITKEDMEEDILPNLSAIKSWANTMEELALTRALEGVKYKGYKVVEGRSNRRITQPLKVMDALEKAGYKTDDFTKPTELKSLTDLERLTGKVRFAQLCGQWVEKPAGKPTLVPDTDKRPQFNSAEEDFKDINI